MISIEEFAERLLRVGAGTTPRPFPRRRRDRQILLKSFLLSLGPEAADAHYSEAQINAHIEGWLQEVAPALEVDHVTVRRHLVDHGLLERTRDGRRYRVGFPARPLAFDLEVDELDVRATVAAYRQERTQAQRPGRRRGGRAATQRSAG